MPRTSNIDKTFDEFGGEDLRSHDAERKKRYAKNALNVLFTPSNGITTRPGFKGRLGYQGGGGGETFIYIDRETEARFQELITIDEELWKQVFGQITITYSGSESNVSFSLIPTTDGTSYYFAAILSNGINLDLNMNLGTGIEESSPVTVADLVSAINALTDFNCSATGDTSVPAAFLPNMIEAVGTSLVVNYSYYTKIYCPLVSPFQDFFNSFNSPDFEIADIFNHANRLFIATGFNELFKYDSVSCYRVGMPAATTFASVTAAGGSLPQPFDYVSFITYEQIDALGHSVEGDSSNLTLVTSSAGNQQITQTIPNILANSGFLTSCALANNGGTQTSTTLTVDDGSGGVHTLQVGQTAFFRDNGGTLQQRKITARTNTTITIDGAAVTIANNEVISANLRINLWRNVSGSTELFYLVRTFANNSFTANFNFTDNVADANLVVQYREPIEGHGLPPPNLKYLTAYQNIPVGCQRFSNTVYYGDFDGPEYWNSSATLRSKSNEPISGIGANKEILLVGKDNETHIFQGSLPDNRFRQELLADAIGPSSHHSIIDVESSLWFFVKDQGAFRIVSTKDPEELSYRILPAMRTIKGSDAELINVKRVIAINVKFLKLVFFFLPCESLESGYPIPNANSKVWVADYRSQFSTDVEYDNEGKVKMVIPKIRWTHLDGLNLAGGATIYDNNLYFWERRYNKAVSGFEAVTSILLQQNWEYDFCDHAQPFLGEYDPGWTDLDYPDILKKFVMATIYSFDDGILGGSFDLNVSTETRFINDVPDSKKLLKFGESGVGSGWGNSPWGETPWGEPTSIRKYFEFKPVNTTALKLKFAWTTYLTRLLISSWSIESKFIFSPKITGTE